jgi:AcrR family transcriptional regulator
MGIQERKIRHKDNLRQAILDAAEELFVDQGFNNVSMRKIAKKIEYSATTIYLYFKDKGEIFHCLLDQYYRRLLMIMTDIQNEYGDDPFLCIRKGMRAYTGFGLENPNYYKLAFMLTPDIPAGDYLDQSFAGNQVQQTLRNNVAECIRRGIFPRMETELGMQILWSMNHGITSLLISNPAYPWVEQDKLIDTYIETAIAGMTL